MEENRAGKKPILNSLSDLKPDPDNPREITPEAMAGLKVSLHEFGDIGGITFNSRTGQLVTGHQRRAQLEAIHGNLPIKWSAAGPYFETTTGEVFSIRLVDWPIEKQRLANLAANNPHIAGEFSKQTQPQLRDLLEKENELFKSLRLDQLLQEEVNSNRNTFPHGFFPK